MHIRLIPVIFATIALCSCSKERYVLITGYAQGGTYTVKCSEGDIPPERIKDGIDSILNRIDASVNGYNPKSLLSRANNGERIDTSAYGYPVLRSLTDLGNLVFKMTGGVVDTRSAALFDIWGFGFKNERMPSEDDIARAMADRSKLNFNAMAQGYSCDLVAGFLKAHKVENMMVNVGGEMFLKGVNPSGKGWTIGIDAPTDGNSNPGKDLSGTFTLPENADCGVVTSGNYRKFYVVDGVKYSHTIDPRTGRPVNHNLLSATIIANNSTFADAIATYCMVVGPEDAKKFIEASDDLEACLISADTTWCSKGFTLNR